jgi:hypothetical protein
LIERADVRVAGTGLAAEICALYLAGAGVGELGVAPTLVERCRALSSEIEVHAWTEADQGDIVEVLVDRDRRGGPRAKFAAPEDADPVRRGAVAARWALAVVLSESTGDR